jgi:plastocyanin
MRIHPLSPLKRGTALVVIPLALIAIAGCGGDNGSSDNGSKTAASSTTATATTTTGTTSSQATVLKLDADPSGALMFTKTTLAAPAGKVTIAMNNPSSLQHDVAIEGNGVDKSGQVVGQGGTSTVTADLKPGKYTYYCSVDGHEQAGMKGTLTVK